MNIKPIVAFMLLALLMVLAPARAEGPDDAYVKILQVAKQADDLAASGQVASAKAKYQQALKAMVDFQRANPDWNGTMVTFRVNGLAEKITALTEKAAAAAAESTNAPKTGTSAASGSARSVKLLDAGAEPRKELRLHPAPDTKQTLTMTLKMAADTKMGQAAAPAMKLPALKMVLDADVKKVADNGTITYALVLSDLEVSETAGTAPEVARAMKAAFAGVKGMTGTGTVSSQGISEGFDVKAAAASNPQTAQFSGQLKELFGQLVAPLPEESVGVGARWEVKGKIKSQGMTVDQTATYELVSLEDERISVKSATVQQASAQQIQNPAMPNMKVGLTKLTGKTTMDRTIDLAQVLPVTGTAKSHTETDMSMNMGNQKQAMTMKMDVEMQIGTK